MTIEEVKEKIKEASLLKEDNIIKISEEAIKENKIPKIIHFCFYQWDNMPEIYLYFIRTWFEKLPDWTIINWNAYNFDASKNKFTEYMYNNKAYAFLCDYIRVWAISKFGGFYFDSDVICHRNLDELLNLDYVFSQECYMEHKNHKLSFECGVFGSKPNNSNLLYVSKHYGDVIEKENAPLKYVKLISDNGTKIETIDDIEEYKDKVLNNSNIVYLLDSCYFSNSNINPEAKNYFNLIDGQYTSHEFTNAWCGFDPNRYISYFKKG